MASDIISQVGKGKRQGVLEAIADTDVAKQIAGSPLGQGIATTVRGIASGAAIPTAFAADQTNTALNAVGGALGFNANLPTDSTSKVMSWGAGQQNQSTVPAIASTPQQPVAKPPTVAALPAIAGGVATPSPTGSKDRFVTSPGAASLVSTPKAIAGMTPSNLQTVGKMMDTGMSANGVRRMDAINQKAIAGIGTPGNGVLDDKGRTYDEQVAHAKQVNAANALPTMSPKQAAELAIANDPRRSRVTRANAAQGVAQFNNQMENAKVLLGNQQAQTIAGIKEQGDKYTSDQHLAGVKYNADAHTKAAEIAGGAAVAKAQQAAQVKQQEQGQKNYADRIKGLMGDWSKLNLPKEYVPKLNEFAKVYAAAEDPNSNTWLMPPNRDGGMYAAMPRQYEGVYSKLLQTMPHNDAAARIYQLAQQNGHVKDVPDFRRFLPTGEAIKNQNQTLIAGA